MDGNRRWSQDNNQSLDKGYDLGIKNLINILDFLIILKIRHVTVYALSSENIKRANINVLYNLIRNKSKNFINNLINKKKININIIGEDNNIPEDIYRIIEETRNKTNNTFELNLNIAFNYGSDKEIVEIIKKIIDQKYSSKEINTKLIKNLLYLNSSKDPDLLIRTGGYKRLSNFILNNLSYTELFFTNTLWPDFKENELHDILTEYYSSNRKYGL